MFDEAVDGMSNMPTILRAMVDGATDEQAKYVPTTVEWYTKSPRTGKFVEPEDGRIGIRNLFTLAFNTLNAIFHHPFIIL